MVVRSRTSSPAKQTPRHNLLLAALPDADYDRIAPQLELIPLKLKKVLHATGELIEYVYFPCGGFCSMLTVLEDGSMVEIATIGREGMVGVTAALDGFALHSTAMVQGESETCYRMTANTFREEFNRRGAFYELMLHYSQALFGFVAQSTACNAVHSVEQRLARWLLMARDRMEANEFPLTQEFVAMMLGASRPTVTVVAGTLQKAGLITYRHGRVTIVDSGKLEEASCECYRAATDLLRAVPATRRS